MQSDLQYAWNLQETSLKVANSIGSTFSSHSGRKLDFSQTIDFDQLNDENGDFEISTKAFSQDNNSTPCFKKLCFASAEDEFLPPSLHNKNSYSSFSVELESYDNEESLRMFTSPQKMIIEEETTQGRTQISKSANCSPASNEKFCFGFAHNRQNSAKNDDFFKIIPSSLEDKSEFFEELRPKDCQGVIPEVPSPMIPSLQICTNSRDPDLWTISSQTLINLINDSTKRYLIIDCRYDYEYKGGHIKSAINIESLEHLERLLFTNRHLLHDNLYLNKIKEDFYELLANSHLIDPETINIDSEEPPILIFHCEFSQKRGPRALRALRNLDRHLNAHRWPSLYYSEIYILEDGYQSFHSKFPEYSCPQNSYVKMLDKSYRKEYASAKERERKSWKKTRSIKQCLNLKTHTQRARTLTYC